MRHFPLLLLPLLLVTACPTNLQQHASFAAAQIAPKRIAAGVGEVVTFEVRPPVTAGSEWSLDSHGRARFVGGDMRSHVDWTGGAPLRFEAIVSPFDPMDAYQREAVRGWLWFGLRESGASQSLDRDLPIERLPFHEIGIVSSTAVFSLAPRDTRLSVGEANDRVIVRYLTPIDHGFPYAPRIRTMLLETGGKKRLYAEVWTNFGDVPKEPIGYEVTLSYPKSVGGPVEIIVVEWLGHGWYYGPFDVHRAIAGGAPEAAPKNAASSEASASASGAPPSATAPAAAPPAPPRP